MQCDEELGLGRWPRSQNSLHTLPRMMDALTSVEILSSASRLMAALQPYFISLKTREEKLVHALGF
jgi:hypothetical protein